MFNLLNITRPFIYGLLLTMTFPIAADSSAKPYSSKTQLQSPPPKKDDYHSKHLIKPELPAMTKPFGMPGVIGLQNGKWEGTDYLGYLSNNIGIDVEILKTEAVPQVSDAASIESRIADIFSRENIVPRADVKEGPPLPFLHVLLIVYPVDKDRYAIFGNGRLFEQIQVIRKDFIPAGYWQGITWENQDISLTNGQQLDSHLKELADKLATSFAKRYRQYNLNQEGIPGVSNIPTAPPATF